MKAIIPVAGVGTRLRPHTHTQPKALVPVAGKPILAHIVDELKGWGIKDFIFVIGYMGDKIEKFVQTTYPEIKSSFVLQPDGIGTGHALWLSRDLLREEEKCLIVLGDTIFHAKKESVLNSSTTTIGVKKVDDPRRFGVAELNSEGIVKKLVEKPNIPKSNLALVGVYMINNISLLIEALENLMDIDREEGEEFHLTDVLMYMVQQGEMITTFAVDSWFDCGKKDILLETNAILLRRLNEDPHYDSETVSNSIIVPPVHLGRDVKVSNSIIGPNVSIGEGCKIEYSIVKNSIVGNNCIIGEVNLRSSVIGNDNTLSGSSLSLNLGDNTEIKMGL